jgi:hypothetical protein
MERPIFTVRHGSKHGLEHTIKVGRIDAYTSIFDRAMHHLSIIEVGLDRQDARLSTALGFLVAIGFAQLL